MSTRAQRSLRRTITRGAQAAQLSALESLPNDVLGVHILAALTLEDLAQLMRTSSTMHSACTGLPRWAEALKVLNNSNRLYDDEGGDKWGDGQGGHAGEMGWAPPAPHDDATCGGCSFFRSQGKWQPDSCYYGKELGYKTTAYAFYRTDPRLVESFFDGELTDYQRFCKLAPFAQQCVVHLNSFFDLEDGTGGPNMLGKPLFYGGGAARFTLLCNCVTLDMAKNALALDQYNFLCAYGGTELNPNTGSSYRQNVYSYLGDGEGAGRDDDIDGIVGTRSQFEPQLFGSALAISLDCTGDLRSRIGGLKAMFPYEEEDPNVA